MATAQVSGQSKPFYRNTLIYKRLTETIFDPVGLGDRDLGNLWRFWVHDWPLWLECVGSGWLWQSQQIADAGLIKLARGLRCFWRQSRETDREMTTWVCPSQTHVVIRSLLNWSVWGWNINKAEIHSASLHVKLNVGFVFSAFQGASTVFKSLL